jgi:hypothetical protein
MATPAVFVDGELICKGRGIAFSSNVQKDYCFECEKKKKR